MTALDIIVLVLIGWTGFLGLSRGFVTETLSLGAWIAAMAAVKLLHGPVTALLSERIGTPGGAAVLAFSLIFGITMFIGRMIAKKMGESSKSSGLGGFDRLLGLGFGALKGLLAATVGFLFATLIADTIYSGADNRPGWMVESRTYPLLNASSSALVDFVNERRNGENAQPKP